MALPVSCPRGTTLVHSLKRNPRRVSIIRREQRILNILCSTSVNATGADTVRVTFKCGSHPVQFGQKVAVVSNVGEWKAENAVSLDWKEGDVWEGDYEVPSGIDVLEFKLVTVASGDVEGDMEVLEWEEGDNKVLAVSQPTVVECAWNSSEVSVEVAKKPKKPKKKRVSAKKTSEQDETVVAQELVVEEEILQPSPAESHEEQPSPHQESEEVAPTPTTDPEPVAQVEEHNDPSPTEQLQVNDQNDIILYSFDEDDGQGESAADMAKRMYGG